LTAILQLFELIYMYIYIIGNVDINYFLCVFSIASCIARIYVNLFLIQRKISN